LDIALWYDTRGAGGSVPRATVLHFNRPLAKREPNAGLAMKRLRVCGGEPRAWGERRMARREAQAQHACR